MDNSVWKTLFGDHNAPADTPGQLWARTFTAVILGACVALIATWLYALISDGDFTVGGAVSSMIGAGLGLGVVIHLNNRRRRDRAQELDADEIDNLPKKLG